QMRGVALLRLELEPLPPVLLPLVVMVRLVIDIPAQIPPKQVKPVMNGVVLGVIPQMPLAHEPSRVPRLLQELRQRHLTGLQTRGMSRTVFRGEDHLRNPGPLLIPAG